MIPRQTKTPHFISTPAHLHVCHSCGCEIQKDVSPKLCDDCYYHQRKAKPGRIPPRRSMGEPKDSQDTIVRLPRLWLRWPEWWMPPFAEDTRSMR